MKQLELFSVLASESSAAVHHEYQLDQLFEQLNEKYWRGKLPVYQCEWSDRMITTWGCCYRSKKLIRISSFFKGRPLPELIALLSHEMIHIRYRGHGARFRTELRRIGLEGDVQRLFPHLNALTHARRRSFRYLYGCPRCDEQIHRRMRIHGYCAKCYELGIRSKFRLIKR